MVRCYCLKLVVSGHKVNMFKLIFAMRIVELIKFSRSILETLSDFDINTSDVRFIDMYADYEAMKGRGEKVTYIVEVLSERYGVSVAKVYRVLRKFRRAVGN